MCLFIRGSFWAMRVILSDSCDLRCGDNANHKNRSKSLKITRIAQKLPLMNKHTQGARYRGYFPALVSPYREKLCGEVRTFKTEGKVFLDTDWPRPGNNIYFFVVAYEWKMYEEQTCKPRMLLLWRMTCAKKLQEYHSNVLTNVKNCQKFVRFLWSVK